MFAWLLLVSSLSGLSSGDACSSQPIRPADGKLQGLTPADAKLLIGKLENAQVELKAGKSESFELLAGAPASYPAALVAPRTAFVDMRFEHPWSIERKPPIGLWQTYELVYFPPGPHSLMWKVDVTVGQLGQLVRVEMLYTAPPPF
jgi:hypothetical protein